MLVEATVVLVVTLCWTYFWLFGFWDRRNVFNVKFEFTRQTFTKVFIRNEHIHDFFVDLYRKYKSEGLVGFYALFSPMLLVTDPELVKSFIVKDFNKFHDTVIDIKKEVDPLFAMNPFIAKGMEKWKERRSIHTWNMTTVRFKEILPFMSRAGEIMVKYLTEKKMEPVMAKDLSFQFTVDVAASCGFGIEPTAFTDPENNFIKYANADKIFRPTPVTMFTHLFAPKIAHLLKLKVLSKDAEDFFEAFIEKMKEFRSSSNVTKNDFFHYIMKMNQKLKEENKPVYTNKEMASHCFAFYVDTTESTANQLSFLLLDLATHQSVQEKLRKEISSISECATGFDLEKIYSSNYLNMVINESMRIHTQASLTTRMCTQDAVIGNTQIPKGTRVFIPVGQFHMDPEYFPNPEKFDPERFSDENKGSIPKYSFIPFGEGPRICVGYKLALLQMKMAVIFLLLNFTLHRSSEDEKEDIALENAPIITPTSKLIFKPIIHNASQQS
ncbi:cytochrome P450 3A25 isoform X2 [Halyomorpha halys]|uniref:cytochrome P450 3A25 isoform X2 n=1 Tax=Halyomorpha halys TaxID=286706 RepID=UPI0006D4FF7B|nr:cytochrome P450 3A25-like isoform X2 [Halyomorpha halys]